ncbi:MAG: zinc-dependent peptidase [Silicimonas sp.]|nr:zinc-dependent peptidase [Silicimonas sp.]
MTYFLGILLIAGGFFGWRTLLNRQTRAQILSSNLSPAQRAIIAYQVPLLSNLPSDLHAKLEGKIKLFLKQVEFIGCDGLEVTEDMRLSIAAQACLLVVNIDAWYVSLRTILIYPGAFKSIDKSHDGYVVTEREVVRTGESWNRGPVILSWQHSAAGARNHTDGHNVVLHEFAHQIDDLSGHTDGVPVLAKGHSYADWERVFVEAYDTHLRNVERGRHTVIDAYGAEGYEEFFAVSVEVFFERPSALKREEPEVYAQLSELFRLDPENW